MIPDKIIMKRGRIPEYKFRTSLPEGAWRRINQGVTIMKKPTAAEKRMELRRMALDYAIRSESNGWSSGAALIRRTKVIEHYLRTGFMARKTKAKKRK